MSIKLDKLWSYIKNKSKQKYLWYNIDHNTGYILAYTFEKKKDYMFLKLKRLLKHLNIEMNYTDAWKSYRKYIDKSKHSKYREKNLNLITRIKSLTRKTICYSKTGHIHNIVIDLLTF